MTCGEPGGRLWVVDLCAGWKFSQLLLCFCGQRLGFGEASRFKGLWDPAWVPGLLDGMTT